MDEEQGEDELSEEVSESDCEVSSSDEELQVIGSEKVQRQHAEESSDDEEEKEETK